MFSLTILFVIIFINVSVYCDSTPSACKKDDEQCHTKSVNIALEKFFKGSSMFGLETSDPLHVDEIVGDLSILKYKFSDCNLLGFKKCQIHHAKLDWPKSKLRFNATCPNVIVNGKYEVSGRLIILPVEGKGDFIIYTKRYEFKYDADIIEVQGKDGKTHMLVKKYKIEADPQEKMTFEFKNLVNGQKDLADAVHKFANENWKEVADFVQEPVVSAFTKKLVGNLNKFLKVVPIDELFVSLT